MIDKIRDHPLVTAGLALLHARLQPLRERSDRGASAVEWAIIAAICVVAAIAIGTAVVALVDQGTDAIDDETIPAPGGG